MTMPQVNRRVVYLEDELDSGEDDDIDLGFFTDETMNLNLPGLCSNNCNEEALVNAYDETEKVTNRFFKQAQAPTCNADIVRDVARAAWPPSSRDMYSSARPSFSFEVAVKSLSERKVSKEKFNYAKALVQSDAELERMARKIRSEIRQYEMTELAREAERAADAGQESFSGRASTFGVGADPSSPKRRNPVPLKHHRRTLSGRIAAARASPVENRKIKVLALRDVSEVIPQWGELHAHMRTHLHRRKVDDETLVFTEVEAAYMQPHMEDAANDTSSQPFSFFENIADMTMMQWPSGTIHGNGMCTSTAREMVDDGSQSSASTVSGRFGTTLSSHLSPVSGTSKRSPLRVPPGLTHPDMSMEDEKNHGFLSLPDLRGADEVSRTPRSQRKDGFEKEKTWNSLVETIFSTSSSLASFQQVTTERPDDDSDDTSSTTLMSLDEAIAAIALFDDEDDDVSSCHTLPVPRTPIQIDMPLHALSEDNSVMLTPRAEAFPKQKDSQFVTPARLRDIRGLHNNKNTPDERDFSTPDSMKVTFEPSSIIDTGGCDHASQDGSTLSLAHLFLALPAIQNVPNDKLFDRNRGLTQTAMKRKLRYPQRRSPQDCPNSASEGSSALRVEAQTEGQPPGSTEKDQVTADNPTDKSVGETPTNSCQEMIEDQDESPHKNVLWVTKEKPISPRTIHEIEASFKVDEHRQDDLSDPAHGDCDDIQDPPSSSEESKSYRKGAPGVSGVEESKECDNEQAPDGQLMAIVQAEAHPGDRQLDIMIMPRIRESASRSLLESDKADESSSNDGAFGMSSDSECIDDQTLPPPDEGETNNSVQSKSSGGTFSPDSPVVRRSMSLPMIGTVMGPRVDSFGKLANAERKTRAPTFQIAGRGCASAGSQVMTTRGSELICPSFQSTEENLQAAVQGVQGMIDGFSPSPCKKQRDPYLAVSDNNEFLNNYFYCVKPKEILNLSQEETHKDSFCHTMGADAVCGGFDFLFSRNDALQFVPKPQTVRERSVSLGRESEGDMQPDGWLDMLGVATNQFTLRFNTMSENKGGRAAYHFEPPCLKKSCKLTPVKLARRTLVSRFPPKDYGETSSTSLDTVVDLE